ncbi:MAG: fibronectin type III domain-containing protein [Patescibacteria group bacterium]
MELRISKILKKLIKLSLISFSIFVFIFSNFPSTFLNKLGLKKFAGDLYIKEAQAALPLYRASGNFTAGVGAIIPPYPASMLANDICLLVVESENQAIALTTANGFVEVPTFSPQSAGTATINPASRLAVFWKRTAGGDLNPTVTDSGNHTTGVIHCFSGVVTFGDPWDTGAGGNDGAVNDTTGAIPGSTTTVTDALVVLITSTSFNGNSSIQCSGFTNADLTNIVERQDNTSTFGLGGGSCMATGEKASIGAYTTTTLTLANTSYKGAISLALKPKVEIVNYVNSTESALDYAVACVDCGARIGGGAGFRQSINIIGAGFGSLVCGTGNCSTAINNIKIGTHQIADANITSWTEASIIFLTDSSVTGDTDTDWGVNFGGVSALTVTAGNKISSGVNFYLFPQITALTQPIGFAADTAREYDAGDTDGVITLNGTRFGSSQGTGSVTIIAQPSTINSWNNTAITAQVSASIVDSINTGSVSMQQGTDGNSKTHSYGNILRVLPRIITLVPALASEGTVVTINGNHFCQGASCPTSFDPNNNVVFTSGVSATVFTSWSTTTIDTAVPIGAITGNLAITSNAYLSNNKYFIVPSNIPSNPTALNQYRDSGLTQAIPIGGVGMGIASSTPIYLKQTMEVPGISGGTLYPQFEYKLAGVNFSCIGTVSCVSAIEGTGSADPGPAVGSISISPANDIYHWQARVRHNKVSDYYSDWISFGANTDPDGIDFRIDITPPIISLVSSGIPTSNTATITWTTDEPATSQVEYGTDPGLVGSYLTTADLNLVTPHSVVLSNLNSGTTYYYRVKSKDEGGLLTTSAPIQNFTTVAVTQPAKTTQFHIVGSTGTVTNSAPLSQTFSIIVPENATSMKSSFIIIGGIYETTTLAPATTQIAVQYEAEPIVSYILPGSPAGTLRSYFKIIHSVNSVNSTSASTLTITPASPTILYINSADFTATYSYTP